MSTILKLEYPFSEDYKRGYLNTNKEPRRVVSLISNNGSRTSISYDRYLMSCELKRYLKKDEQVDHIDNNKMNDVIENLQILSHKENNIKKNAFYGIKLKDDVELSCPVCNVIFKRPARNIDHKIKSGKKPCCSKRCGGIFSKKNKP